MQLGLGKLSVSSTGLHWIGESTETTMTLFFPLSVLSDVRLKRDPDSSDHSSFLLVTVRDALFAQFLINNETECSELVEALISSKKDGLKEMLQMEQSNFASSDLDDWYR